MENQELLLLELEEFDRSNQTDKQISQNLENFIEYVAKTGTYIFPWNKIKKLYLHKITQTIENFSQTSCIDNNYSTIPNFDSLLFNEMKNRILDRMKSFTSGPFTIQRISELLLKPQCNYTRIDKFLRGLEKCVMVVTTIDPQGNKIFTEGLLNGSMNDTSLNGTVFHKTYGSLHIETTTTTITSESNTDKFKLIKQSKVDYSEIETHAPHSNEVKTTASSEDIELKLEQDQPPQKDDQEQINEQTEAKTEKNDEEKIEHEHKSETTESIDEKITESEEKIEIKSEEENKTEIEDTNKNTENNTNNENISNTENTAINDEKEKNENSDEAMDN